MKADIGEVKNVNELTNEKNVKHLAAYLAKYWDINVKPKGYDELKKDYNDFDGMEEDNPEEIVKDFNGFDTSGATCFSFPEQLTASQVVYGEVCQGRSPIHSIVSAVFSYAFSCGAKYQELKYSEIFKNKIEHHEKILGIIDRTEKDEEAKISYRREILTIINDIIQELYFNAVISDHSQLDAISKELDKRRKEIFK